MKVQSAKLLSLVCILTGCGDDPTSEPYGPSGTDGTGAVTNFAGGEFQLRVDAVVDTCLDGGLSLVFMPDGEETPYTLQYPTYLPGYDELPSTYTMKLAVPFQDMQLTMERQGAGMAASDAPQSDVLLSLPGSADCRADMLIGAVVTVASAESVTLEAAVEMIAFSSPTDTCPAVDAVPCQVTLSMTGERSSLGRAKDDQSP